MQVATLFRESSTLLGATSMMESAAATSAPVSTASSTSLGSSSTSTSPPLQAQSPPQILQEEQQTTTVDATIISAAENEAQMTAKTQLGAESEVNTNNNNKTIVSASLSISSLPPPVTDSDVSADNPVEEESRAQSPRSPTLSPSPLSVPQDMDTEPEVQQDDHSQSPIEPDVVAEEGDVHQIPVENTSCSPAQLNEDVDMTDISAPLNNSDPSRDDHYPIVNSVNQMDGCDSNNDNDTGSAAPEPSDCKEDNQAREQQDILDEEPQEHLKELDSMHESLPSENDTEMLAAEELSPPPNVSPPITNVPINLITEQLEHQEHHMLSHHQLHHHHEYPEVQHLQHDQDNQQQIQQDRQQHLQHEQDNQQQIQPDHQEQLQQVQQEHQQHLKQDQQQHHETDRQKHLEQEHQQQLQQDRQQHLEQEHQQQLQQDRQQHLEQDLQQQLQQDRQQLLERDRQQHLERDRQQHLERDRQQHLEQDRQQHHERDRQQHLEQDRQQQIQHDHQQHLEQDLQQQLQQDRQQHLEQDLQQQLQQDRQQHREQDRQQQLQHEQKQAQNHLQQLHHDQAQQHHILLQHEHEQQHQQHHHQLQHSQEQQQHHHQLQHDQHQLQRERDAQHQHNLTVPHHEQLSQHHMQPHEQQDHMQQHHYHHHQFHPQSTSQMHMQQQHHHPQQRHHQTHPITCIDDLMIEDNHEDPSNRYKLLSPNVKHESQDDGYETSAGDVLTPSSHASSHSMTPQHQAHTSVILPKCEIPPPPQSAVDDPYNFIDDELNNSIQLMSPSGGPLSLRQQYSHHATGPPGPLGAGTSSMMNSAGSLIPLGGQIMGPGSSGITAQGLPDLGGPKKRGRKKKIREENGTMVNGILKPVVHKERKKHDRFNGMPEEEVSKRTLPDHLANNLDIIIIGINPGLFAAYKGHHYAGPGNHFWKCLYLSGLTREQMTAEEDYKLLEFGIGFTNMVERATKGSADLTRKEIKEGCRTLLDKLRKFRPKIAVFNGKLIFEVFSGKKDFNFGRQPECIEGTNTYMWVMPSSSARCAQLPRAADKVPFYAALKKFRDYLNGLIPHIEESECVFSDPKYKQCCEPEPKTENLGYSEITDLSNCNLPNPSAAGAGGPQQAIQNCGGIGENNDLLQPGKKKRGRPKKVKGLDGCDDGKMNPRRLTLADSCNSNNNGLNLSIISNCSNGDMPKKKRGRPKKIKAGDLLSSSSANSLGILSGSMLNGNSNASSNNGMTNGLEAINNSDLNHNSPNGGMGSLCGGLSQQQQQRLFSPPMHSPSTVGSYCPLGLNASTPPISTNCNNNNGYHHHPHHQMGTPQHHHNTHQQHHPSYHQQTSQQPPPQQYTPHSDLSSEISAAISSEHLGESPTPTSPSLGHPDFDPPGSMHTDDTNPNELRFSSPASTISEQQQAGSHLGGHLGGYPPYRNPGSNNSYMSGSGGSSNDGHGSDGYMQPASNQSQQQPQQQTTNASGQPLQMSDVASKSLSGLESLVDQIPTMSESDGTTTPNHMSNANPDARLCDPNDQYTNNCLYSGYPNNMQLNSSSPSATPNSSMLSPHYTNPNFSSNPIATNCTTTNTSTYGSLSSNFSVSSLTSSNYPTSSYHSNLMASSPHHIGSGSGSSPMYMEPHMPVPVNPLYHPYSQHSGYSGYSPVAPPPTIHMPSPNYPYGYGNTGSYPQPGHHPSHPAAGYLSNHPSMFDRIKPDIGYGGF